MNILAFAASNSKKSINKALVRGAIKQLSHSRVSTLDINDYEMPIYSEDLEQAHGIPNAAQQFSDMVAKADAVLISLAEHNGSYTAAFKNLLDWCSRLDRNIFKQKKMVLLATSPGPGGASNVLQFAVNSMPFFGGEIVGEFSLPSFYDNFDQDEIVITDTELANQLNNTLGALAD